MVVSILIGTVAGIAAFRRVCCSIGGAALRSPVIGFIAPFAVTRTSFAFWYQTQFVTALVALGCSLAICNQYFKSILNFR